MSILSSARGLAFTVALAVLALPVWAGKSAKKAVRTPARSQIVVVRAETACTAADRAYAATLADRVVRWLKEGGVKADLVGDAALDSALSGRRLAYLVVCQKPNAAQLRALTRLRSAGGRIAVLQSYSPELATFMGMKPVKAAGSGPVATLRAQGGWWSPNLFSGTDAEEVKAKSLLAMAGEAVPGAWSAEKWERQRRAKLATERDYGLRQHPRPGEIHAVWDHSGRGLHPGDWPRTMATLKANGVTDLFVNVAGAGFAHYPSGVLPQSQLYRTHGDQLAACIEAGHAVGVRVHAWILCFNATRSTPVWMRSFAKQGWRLKDTRGTLTEYLDPSNASLRWYLTKAVDEIVRKYPVDGIHLDFVRWYEKAAKPANAASAVTAFVTSARARVRAGRPQAWLTAAVLPSHPSCVASVGQDWERWIASGLIDYAVPMNYVADRKQYDALVAHQGRTPQQARHVISGIGVTAKESTLGPIQVVDCVNSARRAGFAGVALFDLNPTLTTRVLPILHLGLFR